LGNSSKNPPQPALGIAEAGADTKPLSDFFYVPHARFFLDVGAAFKFDEELSFKN
jgi:hypothetical protein